MNLALAYIKLERWEKVIPVCNDALELDPNSSKAYFRRAIGHEHANDFVRMKADLEAARRLEPNNAEILSELRRASQLVAQKEKEGLERTKRVAAKMFSGDEY